MAMTTFEDTLEKIVTVALDEREDRLVERFKRLLESTSRSDPDEMLDAKAAGALVGKSALAMRKAGLRGRIPSHRIGGRVLFRRGDLVGVGK